MFVLYANKNKLTVRQREIAVSGSVNVNAVQFQFSSDWDGLTRTAVFRAGAEFRAVALDEFGRCAVPREVLQMPWVRLMAGVCGKQGEEVILPTVWADLGTIQSGAAADPPGPEPWEQALNQKGDALGYTAEGELGLYAGDKLLSSVPVPCEISDHQELSHRDAADQHPISAITGLASRLERTITTDSVLSTTEILKIMEVL